MACGYGSYFLAVAMTLIALFILVVIGFLHRHIDEKPGRLIASGMAEDHGTPTQQRMPVLRPSVSALGPFVP